MSVLQTLLHERRENGAARGIYSVCSAHPWVIRAAAQQAVADGSVLLIEATSNQVNQQGGYTGMRPADFRDLATRLVLEEGLPAERLILGGDHLGPNPWQKLPAEEAMTHAEVMVAEYAQAGFAKLHLDASMPCAGDPAVLSDEIVAERAARLCAAAETVAGGESPVYIIGTEVPVPGGATESLGHLQVTTRAAAERTLRVHRETFEAHGLRSVWPRVVGLVVQPGVEFNHDSVVEYVPERAVALKTMLAEVPGIVFEAHSTDYQQPRGYQELVEDGFAILKVGPALTFAMREALFALEALERELVGSGEWSQLQEVVEDAMLRSPGNWLHHYAGSAEQQRLLRRYSYSDRMRYYWGVAEVQAAVDRLITNLEGTAMPETLVSAHLPEQYGRYRMGKVALEPVPLVMDRIRQALEPYAAACFPQS